MGRDDKLAIGLILQAVHDLDEVQLRRFAVGDDFFGQKAHLILLLAPGSRTIEARRQNIIFPGGGEISRETRRIPMAIEFKDGKYVDPVTGRVTLDPTEYKDALVLHTRVQRHHGQVMCVHDIVDIAGETQGELGHGHEQGVAAAGRSTLDVHGRTP